jgi:hypothetical protein
MNQLDHSIHPALKKPLHREIQFTGKKSGNSKRRFLYIESMLLPSANPSNLSNRC